MARRRSGSGSHAVHRRLVHLGLRSRITLAFAFGALVLSSALAAITYFTTRSQILSQEETSVQRQTYANAVQLYDELSSGTSALTALSEIDASSTPGGAVSGATSLGTASFSLLRVGSSWIERSPQVGPTVWPTSLKETALGGHPALQYFSFDGSPHLAVGVPVPSLDAVYFEMFSLDQTSRTLHIILASLAVAGVVTTLAGAVLGRWAAGTALRPLRDVSQAALAIASGRLDTRLETVDVRDLAVLASSFNRMVDRLQQRIERDARFTSDVSHELRSPLTTLAASLSVIEARREDLPERSRQALELVGAEVRRFQRMVGELLEISRFDAGSADLERSVVAVGELVRRAVTAAGTANVRVEVDPAVENRTLAVDKRRIERIMTNLLENAEHYAGGARRVVVESRATSVRIAVEDDGPGIPATERERVFERFARGSAVAGKRGAGHGTGLGLALVAEHVKLHGGRVWAEESPTGGARFVVELPLMKPGDDAETGESGDLAGHLVTSDLLPRLDLSDRARSTRRQERAERAERARRSVREDEEAQRTEGER